MKKIKNKNQKKIFSCCPHQLWTEPIFGHKRLGFRKSQELKFMMKSLYLVPAFYKTDYILYSVENNLG
ncbi:MAG: hypothetical protein ACI9ES_002723, partial [Oceanospirillaceae bacterium]